MEAGLGFSQGDRSGVPKTISSVTLRLLIERTNPLFQEEKIDGPDTFNWYVLDVGYQVI